MNNSIKRTLVLVITLVAVFGLLIPATSQPAQAAATVVHEQKDFPLDVTVFLECTGEDIHLSGAVHRQAHYIIAGNGSVHFQSVNNDYDLSAVGLTSGLPYRRAGATIISYNLGDGSAQEFSRQDELVFVRQGDGVVGRLNITVHMTLNANGEITTEFEHIHFVCGS